MQGMRRGGGATRTVTQCANPEIAEMLNELYLEAKELNLKTQYSYLKARQSVERYPVPLTSGKDALQLKGIGDGIAKMIDKKLKELRQGGPAPAAPGRGRGKRPASPLGHNGDGPLPKRAATAGVAGVAGGYVAGLGAGFGAGYGANFGANPGAATYGGGLGGGVGAAAGLAGAPPQAADYLREFVLNAEEEDELIASTAKRRRGRPKGSGARNAAAAAHSTPAAHVPAAAQVPAGGAAAAANATPANGRKKAQGKRPYVPAFRSGGYAILVALRKATREPGHVGFLRKQELMDAAQPYSDSSFVATDGYYSAWSSMTTIAQKGYVVRAGNPARYSLTTTGIELADRLLQASEGFGGNPEDAIPYDMNEVYDRSFGDDGADDLGGYGGEDSFAGEDEPYAVDFRASQFDARGRESGGGYDDFPGVGRRLNDAHSERRASGGAADFNGASRDVQPPYGASIHAPVPAPAAMAGPRVFEFTYVNERGCSVATRAEAGTRHAEHGLMYRIRYHANVDVGDRHIEREGDAGDGFVFAFLPEWEQEGTNVYKPPTMTASRPDDLFAPSSECFAPSKYSSAPNINASRPAVASYSAASVADVQRVEARLPTGVPAHLVRSISITSVTSVADIRMASSQRTAGSASGGSASQPMSDFGSQPLSQSLAQPQSQPALALPPRQDDRRAQARQPAQASVPGPSQASQPQSQADYGPPFVLRPGEYDVVLLVDLREVYGRGKPKSEIKASLERSGITIVERQLPVGDFMWIAREKIARPVYGQREVVLGFAVERKRMDDLAASIKDRRFQEQKFRLFHSGLTNVTMLIEDYGDIEDAGLDAESLRQAVTNTQAQHGFHVMETESIRGTVEYLLTLSRRISERFTTTTLVCDPNVKLDPSRGVKSGDKTLGGCGTYQSYAAFADQAEKSKPLALADMFARHLMQIHGVTPEKAKAITEVYPTPRRLMDAYSALASDEERAAMLSKIRYGKVARTQEIGLTYSTRIYRMYCDVLLSDEPFNSQ